MQSFYLGSLLKFLLILVGFMVLGCAPGFETGSMTVSLEPTPSLESNNKNSVPALPDFSSEEETILSEKNHSHNPEAGMPDLQASPQTPDFSVNPDHRAPPPQSDLSRAGTLKPTIYFFAKLNEDKSSCQRDINLRDGNGKILLRVCRTTAQTCGLQGSCAIVQDGQTHNLNILKKVAGEDRFFEIEPESCRFGFGVRSSCLDPFYTLAADLSLYKMGEVIYVPSVAGLVLPDGSKHNGYFVIRDQGRGIKGPGRFDFFSGSLSWRDRNNPFAKVGLSNVQTNVPYYRVGGETAARVLRARAYPQLPQKVVVAEFTQ